MDTRPVDHTTTDRRLGRLPSGSPVHATVHQYAGGEGPSVYVQAAQHGIELNGPAALRRLHGRLCDTAIAGTVVVVPLVNPLAFDHRSYVASASLDAFNPNLNRVWPGDADGTLQERMAANLWSLVTDADAVVDLHTGTADMLEHVRYAADDGVARSIARAFGTEYLLADPGPDDGEDHAGKLRTAAARASLPAITVELSNSRTVAHEAIEAGVSGVTNVLRELDVLADAPADPSGGVTLDGDTEPTTATTSGLFETRPDVAVGDDVTAGEELGTLYCPSSFDHLATVTAETDGVVYSLTREGIVVAGERLAGVAPRR
ncbi:succinylglutamate desuccinylase/aspartoacylase family protein [Halorientalis marina]|uniref:succinylglutamate desuccinylase/aspartoacylase family protein n=1 Tax=Halorientalis marina TaxID=2931976 RepID=UPI001FF6E7AC|nr:succinylglutamate desuccinylase/aspartoacylase family protein [Halorientalis marina]